jgi:hypothetical protein
MIPPPMAVPVTMNAPTVGKDAGVVSVKFTVPE